MDAFTSFFNFPSSDTAALVTLLAKATLLLVVAFGAATLLQRATAGARHLVWAATLGAVLILPAIVAWSPLRLAVLPAALLGESPATSAAARAQAPSIEGASTAGASRATLAATDASSSIVLTAPASDAGAPAPAATDNSPVGSGARDASARWVPNMWEGFLIAWVVVALALGGWLLMGFLSVNRIVRRATPLDGRGWSGPLYELADRLGIDRTPRIVRSDEVKMPFAAGLVTPTIVLPAESDGWDDERRQAVLMHELAHIRRNDLLGHTLGRIACAIYWFHPLVWRAARRLRIESERACDDLALVCGLRPSNYAEHLLEIVTSVRAPGTPAVAIPMADRKEFEGRMLAILDPDVRRGGGRGQSALVVAGLALMAVLVGGAVPAAQARTTIDGGAPNARLESGASLGDTTVRDAVGAVTKLAGRDGSDRPDSSFDADEETNRQSLEVMRADAQVDASAIFNREMRTAESHVLRLDQRTGIRVDTRIDGLDKIGDQISAAFRSVTSGGAASLALAQQIQQGAADDRSTLLMKVLRTDTSATLRRVAAWGLAQYAENGEVSKALVEALRRERDSEVREMIVWSLASGDGDADVVTALEGILKQESSEDAREMAAWALGSLGEEGADDALTAALSDASPRVRSTAMWALGSTGGDGVPPAVLRALSDSATSVRRLAAWVIFQREDEGAVAAVEKALSAEKDRNVRSALIRALGAIGGASAPTLARLLDSSDPEVRSMVVNALAGRSGGGPWPMPMPRPRPFP